MDQAGNRCVLLLRESPMYLLLTILAGFQLYTSLPQWMVNTLQVTSNSYVLNMDGQKLWSHTMDHVIHLKCSLTWWESTMSITLQSSPHYPQSNGIAEKYAQLVKNLFYKAKEEGKDLLKCLMVYHNTPLSNSLCSPMQILTSRSARSNLPISNAARKQLGLDCEDLRTKYKNEHLPSHDLHFNQVVMYQDPTTKR